MLLSLTSMAGRTSCVFLAYVIPCLNQSSIEHIPLVQHLLQHQDSTACNKAYNGSRGTMSTDNHYLHISYQASYAHYVQFTIQLLGMCKFFIILLHVHVISMCILCGQSALLDYQKLQTGFHTEGGGSGIENLYSVLFTCEH